MNLQTNDIPGWALNIDPSKLLIAQQTSASGLKQYALPTSAIGLTNAISTSSVDSTGSLLPKGSGLIAIAAVCIIAIIVVTIAMKD